MKLHEISAKTANKKRLGRGIGSGSGKTAGRGTKGQNSRTGGGVKIGFEGGQTKLSRRLPKLRGFTAINPTTYQVISLSQLEKIGKSTVDKTVLAAAGMISVKKPVKLLNNGIINTKVTVTVDAASKGAIEAIKKAGGEVIITPKPEKNTKKESKETIEKVSLESEKPKVSKKAKKATK
ncbi:50S ribosomal protein L15 [Candidatus Saccharibacteria bacterium]|nr:50S ribosomal protein L15 [Candidatus Saccharibacteria bacterium]